MSENKGYELGLLGSSNALSLSFGVSSLIALDAEDAKITEKLLRLAWPWWSTLFAENKEVLGSAPAAEVFAILQF